MPTPPPDYGPLIAALAALIPTFGGLMVWYIRITVTRAAEMLKESNARGDKLQDEVTDEKAKNATLTERNRQIDKDIKELQREIRQLKEDMAEYRRQRSEEQKTYKARALDYQNELIKRDKSIKTLQDENKALRDDLEQFKGQLTVIQNKLTAINFDYAAVVVERDELRKKTETLEGKVAAMQAENAAVTKHNGELDGKIRRMQVDMEDLKAQAAPLSSDTQGYDLMKEARRKFETDQLPKITPPDEPGDAA